MLSVKFYDNLSTTFKALITFTWRLAFWITGYSTNVAMSTAMFTVLNGEFMV